MNKKNLILFSAISFLLILTLTGCGMRATSKLPYSTPASYEISVSQKIKQMTIANEQDCLTHSQLFS